MTDGIDMPLHRRSLGVTAFAASLLATLGRSPASAHDVGPTPEEIKAIEGFAGSLAMQAAIYGVPLVAMYLLRDTVCFGAAPQAAPNTIWRISNIATPEIARQAGYVTPNVNVVYGFGFMDLGQEPVILRAPDSGGRYYMIELCDMWTNAFAYPAGKAAGYGGGTFALVGPGWQGTLPAGVTRIDCPTRWVEVQPRVYVKDQADLPAAETVLKAITTTGLAAYTGGTAPAPVAYDYIRPRINPNVASSLMQFDDPLQFWDILSAAMNENLPPAAEIQAVLPQFRYLGLHLGKQWRRTDVPPPVLAQMKVAAATIGATTVGAAPLISRLVNGWLIPPADIGFAGADYLSRAILAVGGLTANTPQEAIYYNAAMDADGHTLDGAKRYTLTFREPMRYLTPVAPGFWSVTAYGKVSRLTEPNPINRYSLGSSDSLARNPDGSFTLYVQHNDPGLEKRANWLPVPAGPFYLILRNYAPVPDVVKALGDPAPFAGPPPLVPA